MNTTYSARTSEALLLASEHWRRRAAQAAAERRPDFAAFTIAISRQAGAGGGSLARELAKRLQWPAYDHELIEAIAREMGLRVSLLESVDERHMSWLLECLQSLSTGPSLSEGAFVRHLMETVLSLGAHGECIIVGRGAAQILPASSTLRVRLVGELDDRIRCLAREFNLSREEAARRAYDLDQQRKAFIEDHFNKDPTDAELYDLVLNSSRFSVAECADIVLAALRKMQARVP